MMWWALGAVAWIAVSGGAAVLIGKAIRHADRAEERRRGRG